MSKSESLFSCPVCSSRLEKQDNQYKCDNNHSFDISRQGYVNLLMSMSSKNKRHGDDKAMVLARKEFLEKGYYDKFANAISSKIDEYLCNIKEPSLLDIGCGEGYYTEKISKNRLVYGIDISKDAVIAAKKRLPNLNAAIASVFNLPFQDNSFDGMINIFAPISESEFKRVLKPSGILLRGVPMPEHLIELKKSIYDSVYLNKPFEKEIEGFELIEEKRITYTIEIDNNDDIKRLFMMTPYYYKTGKNDQEKIDRLLSLKTKLDFMILIYKKI